MLKCSFVNFGARHSALLLFFKHLSQVLEGHRFIISDEVMRHQVVADVLNDVWYVVDAVQLEVSWLFSQPVRCSGLGSW